MSALCPEPNYTFSVFKEEPSWRNPNQRETKQVPQSLFQTASGKAVELSQDNLDLASKFFASLALEDEPNMVSNTGDINCYFEENDENAHPNASVKPSTQKTTIKGKGGGSSVVKATNATTKPSIAPSTFDLSMTTSIFDQEQAPAPSSKRKGSGRNGEESKAKRLRKKKR